MSSVTGSLLSFFDKGVSGANVNVVLYDGVIATRASDGKTSSDPTQLLANGNGKLNIEVFTVAPGAIAPGFGASAFIQGAQAVDNNIVQAGSLTSTEQLLDGSYQVTDNTGGENIQIVGSGSGSSITVLGSIGDTISGSSNAAVSQEIDLSNLDKNTHPGAMTAIGGAGQTTVIAGMGDLIEGGAGSMTVEGGHKRGTSGGDTIIGGAGNLTVTRLGPNDSVVGSTNGTTFIDDTYFSTHADPTTGAETIDTDSNGNSVRVGGNSTLTGGTGSTTFIKAQGGDQVFGGGAGSTLIDASLGNMTITGASKGTTQVDAGDNELISGGNGDLTVTGTRYDSKGNAVGGTSGDKIVGGNGNLRVFGLGKGSNITGSTAGDTSIDDSYGFGGNSTLQGGSGTHTFIKAAQNDIVIGGSATGSVSSSSGTTLNVTAGHDSVIGAGGDTYIFAGTSDTINGGAGNVTVNAGLAGAGAITVNGGSGQMVLYASDNDVVAGGSNNVTVLGSPGGDPTGPHKNETVTGGSGNLFVNGLDRSAANQGDSLTGGSSTGTQAIPGTAFVGAGSVFEGGTGDTINGGTGTMTVFIDSDLAKTHKFTVPGAGAGSVTVASGSQVVNLAPSTGMTTLYDQSIKGGAGASDTVFGFRDQTSPGTKDQIHTDNSIASSSTVTINGQASTVITFADHSTLTLVGVGSFGNIKFV